MSRVKELPAATELLMFPVWSAGLGWAGLGWAGLGWAGLGWCKLQEVVGGLMSEEADTSR